VKKTSLILQCKVGAFLLAASMSLLGAHSAGASQAYGSINNFDVVNDTGTNCYGFEIELDGIHSKDITYTFDWNHYGTPVITEDNTDTNNPKVFIKYEAVYSTNGTNTGAGTNGWSAYTAVPAAPIPPTGGHQFVNPSVNFGGEHFGVGYRANPTNVVYNWLQDNGSGSLAVGPAVSVSTPVFNFLPAAGGAQAQVQAVIVPPAEPIVLEFGSASWVKEIRTTTHTNNPVELRDLASPDSNFPTMSTWEGGEPAEVESEWSLIQTDTGATNGGANGELAAQPEDLGANGDDVVTRRYEFYKYIGPIDTNTGEALADTVAADGTNGVGQYSNTPIVGDFVGAQMAAVDPAGHLGLIDHLPDGEVGTQYSERTVVIPGTAPFTSTLTNGALPAGMSYDAVAGVISGTPTTNGDFSFSVTASDGVDPDITNDYILTISPVGVVPAPHSIVEGVVQPAGAGVVAVALQAPAPAALIAAVHPSVVQKAASSIAKIKNGQIAKVTVTPKAGYQFVGWSEAGILLTNSTNYTFPVQANHALIAIFTNGGTNAFKSQRIVFPQIPSRKVIDGTVTLHATATSKLPVTYTLLSGPASLSNNVLTLTNSGPVSIQASQGGDSNYAAATSVTRSFNVFKSPQVILFPSIGNKRLGAGSVTLNAKATSKLPITYSLLSTNNNATLVGNALSFTGTGVVQVQATQDGDNRYNPAKQVTRAFRIVK
jgi:hypothetical protein